EDGIRDFHVTGVQTCALPILNEHNWYGILSNLTHRLSDNFTFTGGLDARYYKGLHYRRVEDLLGLDAFFDDKDVNNPQKYITDEIGRASCRENRQKDVIRTAE